MDSPLERRIKTYAFVHDTDVDKASRRVLMQVAREVEMRNDTDGLYDELFGKGVMNGTDTERDR